MLYVLAVVLPPVAVLWARKPLQALLNVLLTLFLWVPGAIHALFVVHNYYADQRSARIAAAAERGESIDPGMPTQSQSQVEAPRPWYSKKRYSIGLPIAALIVVVGVAAAVTDTTEEPKPDDQESEARMSSTTTAGSPSPAGTPVVTIAATAVESTAPAIAPTREPTTPAPPTPPPSLETRVEKSYRDNKGFMSRASTDDLVVRWNPSDGLLEVVLKPTALTEGDMLTIAGASAIVASRAIWTTYPEVQILQVTLLTDFTDSLGRETTEPAVMSVVQRSTGMRFSYEGLRDRALSDNKLWFCGADGYRIHLAIYNKLKDKGCLALHGSVKFGS